MVPFVRISSYSRESVVTACVSTVSFSYASVLLSSAYPIDLRLDSSLRDESRQLAVDKRRRHAEAIRHGLQRAAIPHASPPFSPFKTIQELLVGLQTELADDERRGRKEVGILLQKGLQVQQREEEVAIATLIERGEELLQRGHLKKRHFDVGRIDEIAFDVGSGLRHDRRNHRVFHEVVERENGERGEGGDRGAVQLGHLREVLGEHVADA